MGSRQPAIYLAFLSVAFSPSLALAQAGWQSCPVPEPFNTPSPRPKTLEPVAVYVEADDAVFQEKGTSVMQGKAHISQEDKRLEADEATYDNQTGQVTGKGNVKFSSGNLKVKSQALNFNLKNNTGEIDNAQYDFAQMQARGKSKRLVQVDADRTYLEKSTYSACPGETPDWSIGAERIELNKKTERGVARKASLNIRNKPVVRVPYLSFPLSDKRQSGFLWPEIGTSSNNGFTIGTPYYFNLAPNYDATVAPTVLTKRGIQLKSEYRYLSKKHRATINTEYLAHDRQTDKNNRYYYNIKESTAINKHSSVHLIAEGVSDDKYFVDLGSSLAATSKVNLEKRLEYVNRGDNWAFSGTMQDYQILDGGTRPHAKTPQLNFKYKPKLKNPNSVKFETEAEYTNFTGKSGAINGERFDVATRVSKKYSDAAGSMYVKPALSARHTEYVLDDGDKTHLRRSVPTASIDAGVILDRNIRKGKLVQTLEPRVFYTHTPYRNQNAIPVFDSSERSLGFNQLFSENRFTGKDRISDSNHLTVAATTRIQNPVKGQELLHASVGQVFHFADRRVTLPGSTSQQGKRSELVFDAGGKVNERTQVSATTYWDTTKNTFTAGEARVRYKDPKQRILNVGYTERKGDFRAGNASVAFPVKKGWQAVGAVEQDLLNNRNLETVVGAEYQTCCWKSRVVTRNYLLPDNTNRDNAVLVEFELKGLGNFGSGARDLLQNRVYGYE